MGGEREAAAVAAAAMLRPLSVRVSLVAGARSGAEMERE